jgi:hypothetical protein
MVRAVPSRPDPTLFSRDVSREQAGGATTFPWWLTYLVCAGIWSLTTLGNGIPSVRHDWLWPIGHAAFENSVLAWTSGWDSGGIGHPAPYVTQYLFVPLVLLAGLAGPAAGLAAYLIAAGAVTGAAAHRLALRQRATPLGAAGLALFLACNPWTYAELVAGHLAMLVAFGSATLVWAELTASDPDPRVAGLAAFGVAFQPQFFAIVGLTALLSLRQPSARAVLAYGSLAILPYAAGIAMHAGVLAGTPLTLHWERGQSVPPLDALLLRGYFARYDGGFSGWLGTLGAALVALTAVAGAALDRGRAARAAAVAIVLLLVFAAGIDGPAGPLLAAVFERVPAAGFFRELYDLIGLVAAAYAVLAAAALRAEPRWRFPLFGGAALLTAAWCLSPPAGYWVPAQTIAPLPSLPAGRYALLPALQPERYLDRGSGLDPALAPAGLAATPLNTYLASFPEGTALERLDRSGDGSDAIRLGVTAVVCRAGFAEARTTNAVYGPPGRQTAAPCRNRRLPGAPLVAVEGTPRLCSLCARPGDGNAFVGDRALFGVPAADPARRPGRLSPVAAPRLGVNADDGWIDARLAFAREPGLGQAFGGAFTRSRVPLILPESVSALVAVRGRLFDGTGRLLAADTHGYAWVPLPRRAPGAGEALRCRGACAVVLMGDAGGVPTEAPAPPFRAAAATILTPWLVAVRVPDGSEPVLRFLTGYDPGWVALAGATLLTHVRLDATLNGWLLPAGEARRRVTLIHATSVAQLGLETVAFLGFLAAIANAFAGRRRFA